MFSAGTNNVRRSVHAIQIYTAKEEKMENLPSTTARRGFHIRNRQPANSVSIYAVCIYTCTVYYMAE